MPHGKGLHMQSKHCCVSLMSSSLATPGLLCFLLCESVSNEGNCIGYPHSGSHPALEFIWQNMMDPHLKL